MSALGSPLETLRRSVLGAWLAAVYALAVLAAGLTPASAFAAHPALAGAVLCSGQSVSDTSEVPEPANGVQHCIGCPINPALAIPPVPPQPVGARLAAPLERSVPILTDATHGAVLGLPQSRAPPIAS
ncbi:hypothetical protein AB4099_15825 [Bosea sp. 2KB_26]|uniref:hypothetical protein n=1 Tax=Bosea sp. 2KB_26 TaxID=3237475 RepID=UPI003F9246F1